MTEFLSVYVTTATRDEADKIACALVEEKLTNCVNIIFDMTSVYRWQGKVHQENECALLIKITATQYMTLEKRIKELHSYECPCIVATPIAAGSADYLKWLGEIS